MTTSSFAFPLSTQLPRPTRKKRVLLVDTSTAKRDLRAEAMRKLGMDVDCACDIDEARSWWRPDLYNLVLINMENKFGQRDKFCDDVRGAIPAQQLAFLVGKPTYLADSPNADEELSNEPEIDSALDQHQKMLGQSRCPTAQHCAGESWRPRGAFPRYDRQRLPAPQLCGTALLHRAISKCGSQGVPIFLTLQPDYGKKVCYEERLRWKFATQHQRVGIAQSVPASRGHRKSEHGNRSRHRALAWICLCRNDEQRRGGKSHRAFEWLRSRRPYLDRQRSKAENRPASRRRRATFWWRRTRQLSRAVTPTPGAALVVLLRHPIETGELCAKTPIHGSQAPEETSSITETT
jgi:hypothetical protein